MLRAIRCVAIFHELSHPETTSNTQRARRYLFFLSRMLGEEEQKGLTRMFIQYIQIKVVLCQDIIMKSCQIKLIIGLIAKFSIILFVCLGHAATSMRTGDHGSQPERDYHNPYLPALNTPKLKEVRFPEFYLDTALQHSMKLFLPEVSLKKFSFSGGYDRWEGLPTLKFDCYVPLLNWWDRSVFVAPRVSLDGTRESLSVTAGFRRFLGPRTVLGVHGFHDWVRSRRAGGHYLREAGAGIEFSALPGKHSDFSLSVNVYVPLNDRVSLIKGGGAVLRERLPLGYDAKMEFLFPSWVDWLDIRLNGKIHSFRGEKLDLGGYSACLSVNTRNGLLKGSIGKEMDVRRGPGFNVEGSVNLVFDWKELLEGRMPFSAPYRVPSYRFTRSLTHVLHQHPNRRYDLPQDRVEKHPTLLARVFNQEVILSGDFPQLPNARVTVQISQSPWQDALEIITDSSGAFVGKLDLPPGSYEIRLIHKTSGLVSEVRTVVIEEPTNEPKQ